MVTRRPYVLIVEDNPEDATRLQTMLAEANGSCARFEFRYVRSYAEGIRCLKEGPVDAVVLDLTLPDIEGLEGLLKFQTEAPDVPVIVLTEMNDPAVALEVVTKGAQDYLVKREVNPANFIRTILYAIERHKIRQEYESVAHELRQANLRLEKLVLLDPLTNLLNRRGLQEALSREVQRAQRDETELLALILDLDNFKQVNDSLGHASGDIVLKEIAQKLLDSVRATDYVARIGGDEFLVLMPQTRIAEGARVAGKVRRAVSESTVMLSRGATLRTTASLGLISVSPDIVWVDELLTKTHSVLSKSKQSGKNRISYDSHDIFLESTGYAGDADDSGQFAAVLGALRQGRQHEVLKQSIWHLKDRQLVGYEFLSRFSFQGFEMPDDFFRACLENNVLTLVDHQCLKNCVKAGFALPAEMKQHLNLFPSTIIDIPIASLTQIFENQRGASNYCVEISEQQIIGDPSYLVEPVAAFKRCGVRIAIDDVGFGRSCLESLILLEPDIVKIDRKWVHGIARNSWCERSLRRLLKVTEALGTELVAEGIEREEDLEVLVGLGVKYGQGYFLGRPQAI